MSATITVIGSGWSALSAVALLLERGQQVQWLTHSGSHWQWPLTAVQEGEGLALLQELNVAYGLDLGSFESGPFLREFRGKSFQAPSWEDEPEVLWAPEQHLVRVPAVCYEKNLADAEKTLRAAVEGHPSLVQVTGVGVKRIAEKEGSLEVILSSGDSYLSDHIWWAAPWTQLKVVEGLERSIQLPTLEKPKGTLRFSDLESRLHPTGALQVRFQHAPGVQSGLRESFCMTPHKDSGDTVERHLWGYLSSDGRESFWTLLLSAHETEDNHEIAKKLRKFKQTLQRIFRTVGWLAEDRDLQSTLQSEQVFFEQNALWGTKLHLNGPVTVGIKSSSNTVQLLTDGLGLTDSLNQLARLHQTLGKDSSHLASTASSDSPIV